MLAKFKITKAAMIIVISVVSFGFTAQSFASGKTAAGLGQLGIEDINNVQKSLDIPLPSFIRDIVENSRTRKYESEKNYFNRGDAKIESEKVEKALLDRGATLLETAVVSHGPVSAGFIVKYIEAKKLNPIKYKSEKNYFNRGDAKRESEKVEKALLDRGATLLETVVVSHGPVSASFIVKYIDAKKLNPIKYESEKNYFNRGDAKRESEKVEKALLDRGATLLETVVVSHGPVSAGFIVKYIEAKKLNPTKYKSEKNYFNRGDAKRDSEKVEKFLLDKGITLLETVVVSYGPVSAGFIVKYID